MLVPLLRRLGVGTRARWRQVGGRLLPPERDPPEIPPEIPPERDSLHIGITRKGKTASSLMNNEYA
jgi:hypothetical protein